MISFKLFCEASEHYEGLWITAMGEIEDVGFSGHADYVKECPEDFNIPLSTVKTFDNDALVSLAVKQGGIHVFITIGQEKMCELDAYTEYNIMKHYTPITKILKTYNIPVNRVYCLLTKTESRYTLNSLLQG
jgi:hypothetical protein